MRAASDDWGASMSSSIFPSHDIAHPGLRAAIDHAARAHALLARVTEERLGERPPETAFTDFSEIERRLFGRTSELEIFVTVLLEDWRDRGIPAAKTASSIERYLARRVHDLLTIDLGLPFCECCVEGPEDDANATVAVPIAAVLDPDRLDTADYATAQRALVEKERTAFGRAGHASPPPSWPSSITRVDTPTL